MGIKGEPDAGPAPKAVATPSGGNPEVNVPIDPDIHLSDYLRVLYKRRWPVLTVWFVVLAATCVYTFTATPTSRGGRSCKPSSTSSSSGCACSSW